jgi:hypothetical protein
MSLPASFSEQFQKRSHAADGKRVLAGFDGFVDRIVTPVSLRLGLGEQFTPISSMTEFGQRVSDAAGKSTNIELYPRMEKLGGNGPIMANALLASGIKVKYIGALGATQPVPALADFARHSDAITLCDPGLTTAIEFNDGKLMLGIMAGFDRLDYDCLVTKVGGARALVDLFAKADLAALVNWTMLPHMTAIFQALAKHILPELPPKPNRRFFFDLADPEKRLDSELNAALSTISDFERFGKVTLGLNLKEAEHVGRLLGFALPAETPDGLKTLCVSLRERLKLDTVVIHPRKSAACATKEGAFWVPGPYCETPKVTTGAGDHFNAGFSLGQMLDLPPDVCLGTGVATSGFYVRNATSPSLDELGAFLALT